MMLSKINWDSARIQGLLLVAVALGLKAYEAGTGIVLPTIPMPEGTLETTGGLYAIGMAMLIYGSADAKIRRNKLISTPIDRPTVDG